MRAEYIVLGVVLAGMGAVQIWLRHGPGSKEARTESDQGSQTGSRSGTGGLRSGRTWNAWTAILGVLGVILGLYLIISGVLTG